MHLISLKIEKVMFVTIFFSNYIVSYPIIRPKSGLSIPNPEPTHKLGIQSRPMGEIVGHLTCVIIPCFRNLRSYGGHLPKGRDQLPTSPRRAPNTGHRGRMCPMKLRPGVHLSHVPKNLIDLVTLRAIGPRASPHC